jgi:hypothetical protein
MRSGRRRGKKNPSGEGLYKFYKFLPLIYFIGGSSCCGDAALFRRYFQGCRCANSGYAHFHPLLQLLSLVVIEQVVVVIGIEIKVRHQLGLDMIDSFIERLDEFIEILLVQEDLVAVVAIVVETLPTFSNGEVVIVASCSSYIEEIGTALACTDPFAVDAFHFLVVVFVRHSKKFYS